MVYDTEEAATEAGAHGGGLFSGDPEDVVTLIGALTHGGKLRRQTDAHRRTLVVVHGGGGADNSAGLRLRVCARYPGVGCDFRDSVGVGAGVGVADDVYERVVLVDHTPWNCKSTAVLVRCLEERFPGARHRWYCCRYVELAAPPEDFVRVVRWSTPVTDDDHDVYAETVLRLGSRGELQSSPVVVLGRPLRWPANVVGFETDPESTVVTTIYADLPDATDVNTTSRAHCSQAKVAVGWVQRCIDETKETLPPDTCLLILTQYARTARSLREDKDRALRREGVVVCTTSDLLRSWWSLSVGGGTGIGCVVAVQPFESLKVRAACLHALRAEGFRGPLRQLVWSRTVESVLVGLQRRVVDPTEERADLKFGDTLLASCNEVAVVDRLLKVINVS